MVVQHIAIANRATALQNQWTVHAPICSDDKAYFHPGSSNYRNYERIGASSELLGDECLRSARAR